MPLNDRCLGLGFGSGRSIPEHGQPWTSGRGAGGG